MKSHNTWIIVGASFAFSAVAIGAFAAHGLKNSFSEYQLGIVDTAAKYQMYHALAILLSASIFKHFNGSGLTIINSCFTAGILLFSGSLYALAIGKLKMFAYITPIGGLFFLLAWFAMAYFAYQNGRSEKHT